MDTGDLLVLGLVGGGIAYLAFSRKPEAPLAPPPPSDYTPGDFYRGNELGPFAPILNLPFLKQTAALLAPINTELQKTLKPINAEINTWGTGKPTTTVNPDGTITRDAGDSWYVRNVGRPVSSAGSAVVNLIGSIF